MERISSKWKDPRGKKPVNLQEVNLIPGASLMSENRPGLQITLIPSEVIHNANTGHERVPDTGVAIKFISGYRLVENRRLLELVMASKEWRERKIGPNPEDPTGFWRKMGAIEEKSMPIVVKGSVKHMDFKDLVLENLSPDDKETSPLHPVSVGEAETAKAV